MEENKLKSFLNIKSDFFSRDEIQLYLEFEECIELRGNVLLIPISKVTEVIYRSKDLNLCVTGIEVFNLSNDSISPTDIADFSVESNELWEHVKAQNYNSAIDFVAIQSEMDTVYMEIVFIHKSEFTKGNS